MAYSTSSEWSKRAARGENPNKPRKSDKTMRRLLAKLSADERKALTEKLRELKDAKR